MGTLPARGIGTSHVTKYEIVFVSPEDDWHRNCLSPFGCTHRLGETFVVAHALMGERDDRSQKLLIGLGVAAAPPILPTKRLANELRPFSCAVNDAVDRRKVCRENAGWSSTARAAYASAPRSIMS